MESNALDMSCERIQSSFLLTFALLIIESSNCMGSEQEPPGNPAKFPPFNTLCKDKMFDKRLVIILVITFLAVSNNVIGRVFLSLHSHAVGLGMG